MRSFKARQTRIPNNNQHLFRNATFLPFRLFLVKPLRSMLQRCIRNTVLLCVLLSNPPLQAQVLDYYYTFQSTNTWTELTFDQVVFSGAFEDYSVVRSC